MRSKLGIRQAVIAAGVFALGLVAVPPALSASKNECLGGKPNVIGTKGNDVIKVFGYEGGHYGTVNGKEFEVSDAIVFADKGNDRISYSQDGGGSIRVCAGAGKDVITGEDFSRIHGGDGYDTVEILHQCWGSEIFAVETVRSRALLGESWDPGPCN